MDPTTRPTVNKRLLLVALAACRRSLDPQHHRDARQRLKRASMELRDWGVDAPLCLFTGARAQLVGHEGTALATTMLEMIERAISEAQTLKTGASLKRESWEPLFIDGNGLAHTPWMQQPVPVTSRRRVRRRTR